MSKNKVEPHKNETSAATVILQWLTYAFWGWLIVALIWLTAIIFFNVILDDPSTEAIPYAVASTIILLPIALTCDFLYRRREPVKKVGAAMVVMVVHAVLFALLGIAALILATFMAVSFAVDGSISDGRQVTLYTALFASIVYGATFLRTLNPFQGKKLSFIFTIAMIATTALLLTLSIVGPLVRSIATRDDRLIERGLPSINDAVASHINDARALPDSLNDINILDEDGRALLEQNKVEYVAVGEVKQSESLSSSTLRYQLCVTYKEARRDNYPSTRSENNDDYVSSYLSTYSHGAGRTCYKLQQTVYKNDLLLQSKD